VVVQADAEENRLTRIASLSGVGTDIPEFIDKIYPFPAVIDDNNEQKWLGDIVGEDNAAFPEVKLVNDLIDSLVKIQNDSSRDTYSEYLRNQLYIQKLSWIPNNILDLNHDYFNLNETTVGATLPDEVSNSILNRINTFTNVSRHILTPNGNVQNPKILKQNAFLDSYYMYEVLENNQALRDYLYGIGEDDFVNTILNSTNNPTVNGQSVESINPIIISDVERDLFNSIETKQRNLSTEFEKYDINYQQFNSKRQIHSKILPNLYRYKDLTDRGWDKDITAKIKSFYKTGTGEILKDNESTTNSALAFCPDLRFIEGEKINVFEKNLTITANNNIGISNNNISIFDEPLYNAANRYGKTLLMLSTFGITNNMTEYFNSIRPYLESGIYYVPKFTLLYFGGLLYEKQQRLLSNNLIINTKELLVDYGLINESETEFLTFSQLFINYLISYFTSWADENFIDLVGELSDYTYYANINNSVGIFENDPEFPLYEEAYKKIYLRVSEVIKLGIVYPQGIFVAPEYTDNTSALESYLITWINNYKTLYKDNQDEVETATVKSNVLVDKDIKIAVYEDLKSLYDKWIAYSSNKTYNNCGFINNRLDATKREKNLIDFFHFIDRTWNQIGEGENAAVINPRSVLTLTNQINMNLYSYFGKILTDSEFLFLVMPNFVNFQSLTDVKEMFEPVTTLENKSSGASFIAMYIGGNSKLLNIENYEYVNDGFNMTVEDIPSSFSSRTYPTRYADLELEKNKYNLICFKVQFGDQNQSIFKNIQVGMDEHRASNEYLRTLSEAFDKGSSVKRFYKGVDIYNLFQLRSYNCTVNALGNVMIQPYQYFQLNSVPFFNGAYLIINVQHNIKANHIETTFTGYRMPRYVYPIVNQITSYIKISTEEVYDDFIDTATVTVPEEDSNGFDPQIDNIDFPSDFTDRFLFTLASGVAFILSDNITSIAELDRRLENVFSSNVNNMSNYGLNGAYCYAFVKNILYDIGIAQTPFFGVNAWDCFADLPTNNMKYFDLSFSPANTIQRSPYETVIDDDLALVFGYFPNSNYKSVSIDAIRNGAADTKIKQLTLLNRTTDFSFNPITHVGIYYKGGFYDLVNGRIRLNPTTSFIPISYWPLKKLIEQKILIT
jgi:hypothetical protein